jgi:NADH:ubiquinone oxidoreductase subunit H
MMKFKAVTLKTMTGNLYGTIDIINVLLSFADLPVAPSIQVADLNAGLLFFLAMSGLGAYSVVLGDGHRITIMRCWEARG